MSGLDNKRALKDGKFSVLPNRARHSNVKASPATSLMLITNWRADKPLSARKNFLSDRRVV